MNKNTTSLRTVSVYTNGLAYGELTNALYPRMKPIRTINSRFTLTLPPLSAVILKGQEARKNGPASSCIRRRCLRQAGTATWGLTPIGLSIFSRRPARAYGRSCR